LIVISPFTPLGYTSHLVLSHVSLLKYIETLFRISPLTGRDASANGLDEFFDLGLQPRPPVLLAYTAGGDVYQATASSPGKVTP
jgi:hypothetical protein